MASRQSIEAGRGHVTLGLSDAPLRAGLAAAQAKFQSWGRGIMALGASIASTGLMLAAPLALGIKAFIPYEQALADLRAIANPSAESFANVKAKIEEIALASGTMPAEVAAGFTELLRAGVPLEAVVGGMGETLMQLSRVGEMSMQELAVVFSDTMNLFRRDGLSAVQVADLLSRTADTSSINIRQMADAMSSGGSSLAGFNQNLEDVSIALGILGKASIKGEAAGTTLRTFFQRLAGVSADGTSDAADALRELGLAGGELRDSDGNFLRLPVIMERIQTAMSRFSRADQDRLRVKLGGARGERGIAALLAAGTSGWDQFRNDMQGSLTVAEKYAIMMDTLGSQLKRFWVAVTMVGIAIGEALAPKLRVLLDIGMPIVGAIRSWVQANGELIRQFDTLLNWVVGIGAGIFTFGALVYGISIPIKIASIAIGVLWWGLTTLAGGFGLVSFLAGAWGVAVSLASWAVSAAMAFGSFVVGLFTSGFGLLTLAGYAYSVGAAIVKGVTWLVSLAMLAGTGATNTLTLSMIALWVAEGMASLGITVLITLLGALVIAALAAYVAVGGFILIAAGFAAIVAAVPSIVAAFWQIFNAGESAFNGIAEVGQNSWQSIWSALRAGDWAMAFAQIKVAAEIAWLHIKFFAMTAFYAIKDGMIDAFRDIWKEMKIGWVMAWATMQSTALLALAALAREMPGGAAIANRLEAQERAVIARAANDVDRIRRGDDLTPEQRAARDRELEARRARDLALAGVGGAGLAGGGALLSAFNVGLAGDVAAANRRLQDLQAEQSTRAMLVAMAMFIGGTPETMGPGRTAQNPFGDNDPRNNMNGPKFFSAGTFSRWEAAGFLGAMTGVGESRAERLHREQRDLNAQQVALLQRIADRRGVVMA